MLVLIILRDAVLLKIKEWSLKILEAIKFCDIFYLLY